MSDWQPIDTAPKDGTPVLLAVAGGEYNARSGWWEDGQWTIDRGRVWIVFAVEPTHWAPLMEPPK